MKLSAHGLAFLSAQEGLRLAPYNDSAGHATIGVGHLIHYGPVTAADRSHYRGFDRAAALSLLKHDASSREAFVSKAVKVPLNQNEFDALVSLTFNIGNAGFKGSTVLRKLNAGDRRGAANAFLLWRRGGAGLIYRRQRERSLFLKPAANPLRYLTPKERELVLKYDKLRAAHKDVATRRRLRAAMARERNRIRAAAKRSGWDKHHRRERYNILAARTRGV